MSFSREHSIRFVISELTWKHDRTVHLSLWSIWFMNYHYRAFFLQNGVSDLFDLICITFSSFHQGSLAILSHHLEFENQHSLLQNTIFLYQICKARIFAKWQFIYFSIIRMILDKSRLMFYLITSYSLFSSHLGFKGQDLLRKF